MTDEITIRLVADTLSRRAAENYLSYDTLNDYFNTAIESRTVIDTFYGEQHLKHLLEILDKRMSEIITTVGVDKANMFMRLHRNVLNALSVNDLDCYFRFLEWRRQPEAQFYMPRRDKLLPIVQVLQRLEDGELDLVCISLPPGVGKTTLAEFFITHLGGKRPDKPILTCSHSASFLEGVYKELLRLLDPDGDYNYNLVFPQSPVVGTNAQNMRIDLAKNKRFETYQFTSVGAGNAGKLRCEGLLYCDDLVPGIEAALSAERMEKLWQAYVTDLRQRKKGDCPELHIATRWSVHDPIGKLEILYGKDERSVFIRIPALDDNDQSNFDYKYGVGFTTEFFLKQREIMCESGDEASWNALYQNEPIEREGQLYAPNELRRFFDAPKEPDIILAVVDTKTTGSDYCSMPVVSGVGEDYYLIDWVCDNGKPEIVKERLAETLVKNNVQFCQFEGNAAGTEIASQVAKRVKELGGKTKITTRYTTAHKETKILAESPWVKSHVLFKDKSVLTDSDKDYKVALKMLNNYALIGKNAHDDVPDSLAQLSQYVQSFLGAQVKIFKRPF